jgi:hypothetical protein
MLIEGSGQPRKRNIPERNNTPTVKDLGLTSKEIHEARHVRDAEKAKPGLPVSVTSVVASASTGLASIKAEAFALDMMARSFLVGRFLNRNIYARWRVSTAALHRGR